MPAGGWVFAWGAWHGVVLTRDAVALSPKPKESEILKIQELFPTNQGIGVPP